MNRVLNAIFYGGKSNSLFSRTLQQSDPTLGFKSVIEIKERDNGVRYKVYKEVRMLM